MPLNKLKEYNEGIFPVFKRGDRIGGVQKNKLILNFYLNQYLS
jgi:hypothetical protein